jgi:plastocyanin
LKVTLKTAFGRIGPFPWSSIEMKVFLTALCAAMFSSLASAEVHVVNQQGLTFVPETITVNPGDTVRWIRNNGIHNVTNGLPCNEFGDPIFETMPLDSSNPIAEWLVPDAVYGEVPYFCSIGTHCAGGMVGTINVVPAKGTTVHEVEQLGITFEPATVFALPGDVIRWNWNNGGHTVSSGNNQTCIEDDVYFNLLLDDQHQSVLWKVPDDITPGTIPYLCIFHCFGGHIGDVVIAIQGDLNGDGIVDGADLTLCLGCWGKPCADVNGDLLTDGSDLSIILGNWTVDIP